MLRNKLAVAGGLHASYRKTSSLGDRNLKTITAAELLERQFRPRGVVIEPWLREEETAVVWAASGVGKTMLCLSLALAVAGQGTTGEWSAPEARKVLYIDGEMHIQDLRDRIQTLLDTKAVVLGIDREEALSNLVIQARQDQEVGTEFYDLTNEESRKTIIHSIRKYEADLVILDNLTTLSDGLEDENDAVSFKSLQGFFMELKRNGTAAILVHHSNKSGREPRGSTSLETTFEVILGLKKPSIPVMGKAHFNVEFGKFRGKGDERTASKNWQLGDDGWKVDEPDYASPEQDSLYLALISRRYTSQTELAEALNMNQGTVSKRIKSLVARGVLGSGEAAGLFAEARKNQAEAERMDTDLEF